MEKPALVEHAEAVVWRHASWRCELWIVNGTPRLRLFNDESVVQDFAVAGALEALRLGADWRAAVASGQGPHGPWTGALLPAARHHLPADR